MHLDYDAPLHQPGPMQRTRPWGSRNADATFTLLQAPATSVWQAREALDLRWYRALTFGSLGASAAAATASLSWAVTRSLTLAAAAGALIGIITGLLSDARRPRHGSMTLPASASPICTALDGVYTSHANGHSSAAYLSLAHSSAWADAAPTPPALHEQTGSTPPRMPHMHNQIGTVEP